MYFLSFKWSLLSFRHLPREEKKKQQLGHFHSGSSKHCGHSYLNVSILRKKLRDQVSCSSHYSSIASNTRSISEVHELGETWEYPWKVPWKLSTLKVSREGVMLESNTARFCSMLEHHTVCYFERSCYWLLVYEAYTNWDWPKGQQISMSSPRLTLKHIVLCSGIHSNPGSVWMISFFLFPPAENNSWTPVN